MTKYPSKDQLIELREAEEKATKAEWRAHSKYSGDHPGQGSVRGPFKRWFMCLDVLPEYQKNVAAIEDDCNFAASAMNLCKPMLDLIDKLENESIEREKTVKVWIQSEKQARDYAIKLQNKLETAEKALIVCTTYCGDMGHGDAAEQALAAIRGKQ